MTFYEIHTLVILCFHKCSSTFPVGIPAGEAAGFVYSVNRCLIANWNNYVTPYNVYTGIMQIH